MSAAFALEGARRRDYGSGPGNALQTGVMQGEGTEEYRVMPGAGGIFVRDCLVARQKCDGGVCRTLKIHRGGVGGGRVALEFVPHKIAIHL